MAQPHLRATVHALSAALDLVGVTGVNHGHRVAYVTAACARALRWTRRSIDDLVLASLVHDCGVSNTEVHASLARQLDWEEKSTHCLLGSRYLSACSPLRGFASTVEHHHTHWSVLAGIDLPAEVKRRANLVFLGDRVDAFSSWPGSAPRPRSREWLRKAVSRLGGTFFAPALVDAFLSASADESFWPPLEQDRTDDHLRLWLAAGSEASLPADQLKEVAALFARVVDAKSRFTAEHCTRVARLSRDIGGWMGLGEEECDRLELAGLLHDLGKLRVPDHILEKPEGLDEEERRIMERHALDTLAILGRMPQLGEIVTWCADHHEALDGRGYPRGKSAAQIPVGSRIVAVADWTQALAQDRPYRPSMPVGRVLSALREGALGGHIDPVIVRVVRDHGAEAYRVARG